MLAELLSSVDMAAWLDSEGIAEGTPFLISPDGEYDVPLNSYALSTQMAGRPHNTQLAFARDIKGYLNFLWNHRPSVLQHSGTGVETRPRTWFDATSRDREVYKTWRNEDPAGPKVQGSTWNREVSTVDGFYKWAVRRGLAAGNPIDQREVRPRSRGLGSGASRGGQTAADRRPDGRRHKLDWLPPETYRLFRDVGLRGYLPSGLSDRGFRGKRTARNAVFADFMVRTGLRLEEQSSLTLYEVPDRVGTRAYCRFWLPAAVAKWGSARDIYVPDGVLRAVGDYVEIDRADAVERAQAEGRYQQLLDPIVIEDPQRVFELERCTSPDALTVSHGP